jgi:2,4-dienoyl-CoA reductase-like NADH-dependent reductase (Old Yellow Enzyme family)
MSEIKNKENVLKLFDRFESSKYSVKNRFLRSATVLGGADENGKLSPEELSRYAQVAAGGAGTVVSGSSYISRDGKSLTGQCGMDCDERIADAEALAKAAHRFGAKCVIQAGHAGGYAGAAAAVSPSGGMLPSAFKESRAAAAGDIAKIKNDFVQAALRVKKSGADAVQLHGAHGVLLMQFFSPFINKRTDEYGGTFENRARLLREVLGDVRAAVGDFPIWFKLSMEEGIEDGYGAEEGIALAKTLLADGADAIEVSTGARYSDAQHMTIPVGISPGTSEAPLAKFAKEIKKFASHDQLVILTCGLRSLEKMSELLEDGTADLFGMSRPFNAEPDLINRWYYDDERPSACFSCNACTKKLGNGLVDCPVMRDKNEGIWDEVPES